MKTLLISNKQGEKLSGCFEFVGKDVPLALISHGHMSNKDRILIQDFASTIFESGINSFRFDYSGHKDSEGRFEDFTYSKGVEDLNSLVKFFKAEGFKEFWLVGQSQGATISVIFASENEDISYIITQGGLFYPKLYRERILKNPEDRALLEKQGYFDYVKKRDGLSYRVTQDCLDEMVRCKPMDYVRKIKAPITFVHSVDDEVVPWTESLDALKCSNPFSEGIFIRGANHVYDNDSYRLILMEHIRNLCLRRWVRK